MAFVVGVSALQSCVWPIPKGSDLLSGSGYCQVLTPHKPLSFPSVPQVGNQICETHPQDTNDCSANRANEYPSS